MIVFRPIEAFLARCKDSQEGKERTDDTRTHTCTSPTTTSLGISLPVYLLSQGHIVLAEEVDVVVDDRLELRERELCMEAVVDLKEDLSRRKVCE
jgi:hypothetical protein